MHTTADPLYMVPVPDLNAPPADAATAMRHWRGRKPWLALGIAILAAGLGLSIATGLWLRSSVRSDERQAFNITATDVGETVEAGLRNDSDYVSTLGAVLSMRPHLTPSEFSEWLTRLGSHRRQTGGLGTLVVRPVAARSLAVFQARRNADPAFRALVGGRTVPVHASGRAVYCLLAAGGTTTPYTSEVSGLLQGDWCDPRSPIGSYVVAGVPQAALMPAITDTGTAVVYGVKEQGVSTFFIEAPFYARGVRPASATQRRAAVRGWVSSSFDLATLVRAAVGGHHGLAVTLTHANPRGRPQLIGRAGPAATRGPFTRTTAVSLNGTWAISITGAGARTGLRAGTQGLLAFGIGAVLSLLVTALVLALTRSRERALGMVDLRTVQLRHQALHDALTGLPNRILALDRAEQMLARSRRSHSSVAALYVDVDGFKRINDTFGHAAGDELLRTVATRLATVVRDSDTAARLGGDEFVVFVEGPSVEAGPELVAQRLLEVLRRPYHIKALPGQTLSVSASIGVAVGVRDSADELLADADLALYAAKAAGRDRYVIFRPEMQLAARERVALELDLAQALEREELFLLYQPTFDLQSEHAIGVEALLRWRHPLKGVLAPAEFLPIAEQTGLIVPIGRWVLREACNQASIWRRRQATLGIAVNVSSVQLESEQLTVDVGDALDESGLAPGALTLEITESALMRNPDRTAHRLDALKGLGVRVAIDDFGTEYSSLAYLSQFPVDALKIDRSFIAGIAASREASALIHTLVQLGKALHIETLAEGIEEQAQLRALQREQCDHGQGFLFSRPLDVDAAESFLQDDADGASGEPASAKPANA